MAVGKLFKIFFLVITFLGLYSFSFRNQFISAHSLTSLNSQGEKQQKLREFSQKIAADIKYDQTGRAYTVEHKIREEDFFRAIIVVLLSAFALLILSLALLFYYYSSKKNPITPYINGVINYLKNQGFLENENSRDYLSKKSSQHRQLFNLILQNTSESNIIIVNQENILSNCIKPVQFQKKINNFLVNWIFFKEKMIGIFPARKNKILLEILLKKSINSAVLIYKQNPKTKFIWDNLQHYGLREDVDIESKFFNKKYQIFTTSHSFAFKILDPSIIDFLNQEPHIYISIRNNSILIYLTKNLTTEQIEKYFSVLIKFAKHIESIS